LFCIKVSESKPPRKEWMRSLFQRFFVPFVFNKWVEILTLCISVLLFVIGVCSCLKLGLGLN
jgi:hypothetical protein